MNFYCDASILNNDYLSFLLLINTIINFRFLVKDRYTQFSPAQRSLLVMQILLRVRYDNTETKVSYINT